LFGMDRKKLLQKFHDEDVKQKKQLGRKATRGYLRKQREKRLLESSKYQALRVAERGVR